MTDVSVVGAIAAMAFLSFLNRPTNSAARCWLSAALPPFPKITTLPPLRIDLTIALAARAIFAIWPFRSPSFTAMLSFINLFILSSTQHLLPVIPAPSSLKPRPSKEGAGSSKKYFSQFVQFHIDGLQGAGRLFYRDILYLVSRERSHVAEPLRQNKLHRLHSEPRRQD